MRKRRWIMLHVLLGFMLLCVFLGNILVDVFLEEALTTTDELVQSEGSVTDDTVLSSLSIQPVENPSSLGIFVQKKTNIPRNQMQWHYDMKQTYLKSHVIDNMVADNRIIDFQENERHYLKRLRRIEKRITYYEKQQERNPDKRIVEKLQHLYMLKATLSVFEEQILIRP